MGVGRGYRQSKSHVNKRVRAFRSYQKSDRFTINIKKAVAASHKRYNPEQHRLKRITGLSVREIIKLREAYRIHKAGAKSRGIEFCLTYEEWLLIWIRSGRLKQRGNKSDQYVMARKWDIGPYSVSNVDIIMQCKNNSVGHGKSILVNGIRFASIKAAANHYNIPYARVKARLRKGWSMERVFDL